MIRDRKTYLDFGKYIATWVFVSFIYVDFLTQPRHVSDNVPVVLKMFLAMSQWAVLAFPLTIILIVAFFWIFKFLFSLFKKEIKFYWIFLISFVSIPLFYLAFLSLFPPSSYP